jgi:hypothetical protein
MIVLYVIIILIVVMEFATILTFGWFIPKKTRDVFMNLDESKLRLNMFNPSILSTKYPITNLPFSLFSKYYIKGVGTIPRWTKLHKKVNHYFLTAIKNEIL